MATGRGGDERAWDKQSSYEMALWIVELLKLHSWTYFVYPTWLLPRSLSKGGYLSCYDMDADDADSTCASK